MKQLLFFIFILGISTSGYAQFEGSKTFKVIPPQAIPPKAKAKEAPKKIDDKDPFAVVPTIDPKKAKPITEDPTYSNGIEPEPFSMIVKKPDFDDPGQVLKDRLSQSLEKSLVNRGMKFDPRNLVKIDVNFGDIRTKSKFFVIKCRDFGEIDGDLIKATLNNQTVEQRLLLQNSYKTFTIYFKEGINTFELEALNRGTLGGNTAEFQIYDDTGKLVRSDYWENWDTGVKGSFIIVKE
ncbi:hypothetical protein FFWV33_10090 [Flavobacterium faecale]|uniref:Uncharacterized protein n=1 Tax=Flavobacterium faecale TaxID=1355330 RepID=A0A2S1LEA0_9FLAO|nr:hypothetical protein [Flavobacterium faecale]AWG21856.1 hypothetical protein FFWV33_10090 [Flavobacterium faecale]